MFGKQKKAFKARLSHMEKHIGEMSLEIRRLKQLTCEHEKVSLQQYYSCDTRYRPPVSTNYGYAICGECGAELERFKTRREYLEYQLKLKEKEVLLECEGKRDGLEKAAEELEREIVYTYDIEKSKE